MDEGKKLLRSFGYAFRGIGWAIRTQRNMRIHLVGAAYVLLFGWIMRIAPAHLCLELLCCMAVISLELVNSALERICDGITKERKPWIRDAKDAAAGAVLISAIGSVIVALVIFFGGGYLSQVQKTFAECPISWIAAILMIPIGGIVVFLPSRKQLNDKK